MFNETKIKIFHEELTKVLMGCHHVHTTFMLKIILLI